jgi:biotin carboxyl carrier protein
MISGQVKDYCYGLYGRPPAAINEELRTLALKGYPRGEKPIDCRPADVLEPELEKAKAEIGDLAKNRGDLLLYAQFPSTGKKLLSVRAGLEPPPAEWKAKTLEDARREEALIKKALAGELVEKKPAAQPGPGASVYKVFVEGEEFEVAVEGAGGAQIVAPARPAAAPAAATAAPAAAPRAAAPKPAPAAPKAPAATGKGALMAPMPGMIVNYLVKPGDVVKAGDIVVILEAMKMENSLDAPVSGTVKEVCYAKGDTVSKDAVLLVIE